MAFYTHFLITLLQASLLLRFVHAVTTVTTAAPATVPSAVTTYAQPLPCFGFCLALDPGIIRRDDGVSDIVDILIASILSTSMRMLNLFSCSFRFTSAITRMEEFISKNPQEMVPQVSQDPGLIRDQLFQGIVL